MRILILANHDLGLYKFRKELIEELLKTNEVFISLPYGEFVEPLKDSGCKFIDTPIDRRGINPFRDVNLLRKYKSIMDDIKPDLVITYTIKPNIYGGMVCRRKGISYATNITGLGTAFERGGMLKTLVEAMYKIALKNAKTVFFENSYNQELFLLEKLVTKDQCYLLNGAGVNVDTYSYIPYPNNKTFKFLFIGRVMKEKGVDELFACMKKLINEKVDCSLDVVGPCEDDYKDILSEYESEGWMRYLGYQKDVRPYIRSCDCFVLPSHHEGMANTNLECAASGRPIITSNIPGCREAVIDGVTGLLCCPRDDYSLFSSLRGIVEKSREERTKMGVAGREHMKMHFDKMNVVNQTISRIIE